MLFLATCIIASGCAAPEIDEVILATQFQDAQQAVNDAAALDAEPLVPEEYGRAVKLLNFARNSREKGDIPQSAEFAYQAELVAQIANAKARQHHARKKVVTIREQIYQQIIKAHEHELEIARIREAILEEQLARALSSRDKGQQQTEQLSTELAHLKISLRQTELRLSLMSVESLVNVSKYTYPAIEKTADYERAQASIASIASLIVQEAFVEAADAISGAQKLADNLYQLAQENQKVEAEARTSAHIAITKAEVIIQRAQYLNANQHAPEQFQEATAQLKRAQQELATNRYEQAQQFAQRAQQIADETVIIAEAAEFRQRAQAELDRRAAEAQRAVDTLKADLAAQANTQVPQLEARLYELANTAYAKAKSALVNKEYETAIAGSMEGSDYLKRAIANAQRITSAKSDLLKAARQIPKAIVMEQRDSVLIRIRGNAFAHGSTQLQREFFATFEQLASVLRRESFSSYPVRIEVHTSALGNANVNRNVSMGRADSIKRVLVEERVNAERLTPVGLGENAPLIEDGPNKEEQNRRIDIIIKTN
ncbi:OmpA family protein [Candidatus Poribacteria bacterium]|nr:OmpA family protein [Candidatus Poribacteria bacterium]